MLYNKQWEKPEVKTHEEWRQVLLDAANLIEQHGWVQCEMGYKNIGFCALGAIEEAVYGDTDGRLSHMSSLIHRDAILHLKDRVHNCVDEWNDHKQRTKRQVVETMRAAAQE